MRPNHIQAIVQSRDAGVVVMYDNDYLQLVIDSADDFAIFTTDTHGTIQLWNSGAQQIFGWSAEEAHGQHARLIFTPEDQDRGAAESEMRSALATGQAVDERWHIRKNATRFYASGVLTVLRRDGQHIGFVKIARDLTDRQMLEDALRQANDTLEARVRQRTSELVQRNESLASEIRAREAAEAQIRKLLDRMVTIQEGERRRIARDLHDVLGQAMTAMKMSLEALEEASPPGESFATRLARCQHLAREVDTAIDSLIWELRPVVTDRVPLSTALAELVENWSDRFNIPAGFVGDGAHLLPPDVQEHLYRLTQEALHNITKHAAATHVSVTLQQRARELVLLVEDNGRGFSVDQTAGRSITGGLGLASMQERAALAGGTLSIESNVGQGTAVYVRVPLDPIPSAQPRA